MKKIIALLFSAGLVFTVGCHHKKNAELLLDLVYKYNNNFNNCVQTKSTSNCVATVVNEHTHKDGRVVIQDTDKNRIAYYGLDMTTFPDLLHELKNSGYTTSEKRYATTMWINNNRTLLVWDAEEDSFRDYSTLEIFSENDAAIKDLELIGANIEESQNENLGEVLSANYGLSVDRSLKVAKLITQYKKLATKRALTAKEKNYFSNELLGTDYDSAFNSISSGDTNNLLERAADINGTSPEAVSTILTEIFL